MHFSSLWLIVSTTVCSTVGISIENSYTAIGLTNDRLSSFRQLNSSRSSRQFKIFATLKTIFNFKRKACYESDGFGCFDLNDPQGYRLAHSGILPDSPEYIDVLYELITPANPGGTRYGYKTDPNTMGFDPLLPLKVVVHGMSGSIDTRWMRAVPDAFVQKLPQNNVLMVDWRKGAAVDFFARSYSLGVANVEMVGRILGNFLMKTSSQVGIAYSSMHLIGLSFGAQIAGMSGAWIKGKLTNGQQIGRISGMDPAFPLFGEKIYSEERQRFYSLDSTDAAFVDIVHTNMGDISVFKSMGQKMTLGHVDFLMNGGLTQPYCPRNLFIAYIADLFSTSERPSRPCSHERSYSYYAESITAYPSCEYISTGGCDSYDSYVDGTCFVVGTDASRTSSAGYYANTYSSRGIHYVSAIKQPHGVESGFCGFQYLLEVQISGAQKNISGSLFVSEDYQLYARSSSRRLPSDVIIGSQTYKSVIISTTEEVQQVTLKVVALLLSDTEQSLAFESVQIRDRTGTVRWRTCGADSITIPGSKSVSLSSSCP